MDIRTATPRDYPAIQNACILEGWRSYTREDFPQALANSITLVAYRDEEFLGFLRALSDGVITLFVCELLVVEAHRKQGVGSALLQAARALYPITRTDLISEADGFYEANGFHAIGKGYRKLALEGSNRK